MKTKKETILSVLIDIRNLLRNQGVDAINVPEDSNFIKITFPNKTAREIVDECGNKLGTGKLLYNPTGWYEKEDFYTTQKCRPRTVYVSKELIGLNKDWNECKELVEKEKGEMLNFAEMIYFIQEYYKQTGKYPWNLNWSWTSSHSSDGLLVFVGYGDSDGVYVVNDDPRDSVVPLGVCFSAVKPCNLNLD